LSGDEMMCLFHAASMFVKIKRLLLLFKRLSFPVSTAKNLIIIENLREMSRQSMCIQTQGMGVGRGQGGLGPPWI